MLPTSLRYFLQVAKTGSVNGASERLNVASSAISRQISALEAKLSVQLFERCSTGMILTAAGQKLADYAHRAIIDADEVISELHDMRADYHGRIRVAASDGLANILLPDAIYRYRQEYAEVEFEVIIVPPHEVARLVREGEVDVGIFFGLAKMPPVQIVRRFNVQTVALMHPDHDLASYKKLTMKDIEPYPIAIMDSSTSLRKIIDMRCAAEAATLNIAMTSSHVGCLLHYARLSGGITFSALISGLTWVNDGFLKAIPFQEDKLMDRSIVAITMLERQLPNRVSSFIECLGSILPARI